MWRSPLFCPRRGSQGKRRSTRRRSRCSGSSARCGETRHRRLLWQPVSGRRFLPRKSWVTAFSTVDVAQRAVGRALFGQVSHRRACARKCSGSSATGRGLDLPANPMKLRAGDSTANGKLKPAYEYWTGPSRIMRFPEVCWWSACAAKCRFMLRTADVRLDFTGSQPRHDLRCRFADKAVVTTTLVAMQVEAGRIALDLPVARYVPEWNAGPKPEWRKRVTVRHLLTHSSGLPAHKDISSQSIPSERRSPMSATSPRIRTWDEGGLLGFGFILLGEILERVTGRTVDQLARERIFGPLGMANTQFNPPKALVSRIAPRRTIRHFASACFGESSRRKCVRHGRRSRTRGDVRDGAGPRAFCQMLLNGGSYAHQRLLTRATLTQFVASQHSRPTPPAWMDVPRRIPPAALLFPRSFAIWLYRHVDLD